MDLESQPVPLTTSVAGTKVDPKKRNLSVVERPKTDVYRGSYLGSYSFIPLTTTDVQRGIGTKYMIP